MLRELVKAVDSYLNMKGGLNAQEEELRLLCNNCKGTFPISSLARADLEDKGYDTSGLTDDRMVRLASKMGDVYVENHFWESLEEFAALYNIPSKK